MNNYEISYTSTLGAYSLRDLQASSCIFPGKAMSAFIVLVVVSGVALHQATSAEIRPLLSRCDRLEPLHKALWCQADLGREFF